MTEPTDAAIRVVANAIRTKIARPLDKVEVKLPKVSDPEEYLAFQLKAVNAPLFERQFRIHPERRFRADFYFPLARVVVEVEGGAFVNGRHSRGTGVENDAEKSALIAQMPARLIRVTPRHVKNGQAVQWILKALST